MPIPNPKNEKLSKRAENLVGLGVVVAIVLMIAAIALPNDPQNSIALVLALTYLVGGAIFTFMVGFQAETYTSRVAAAVIGCCMMPLGLIGGLIAASSG